MTNLLRRLLRVSVAVAVVASGFALTSTTTPAEAQASGCNPSVRNFTSGGPYRTTSESDRTNTIYSPRDLGSNGCSRHPVILWGNGTFTSPGLYGSFLNHLASHGFIVVAANTSNAGSGRDMLTGLDTITRHNSDSRSRFNNRVDTSKVASIGHSQGGGGAINAAKDRRVTVTVPMQPWLQNERGMEADAFFISSQNDLIVSSRSVRNRFTGVRENIPAGFGELRGDGHNVTLGNAGNGRGPATAFMRWRLMGDRNAEQQFIGRSCGYCNDRIFSQFDTNNRFQSLAGTGGGGGGGGTGGGGSDCSLLDQLLGRCDDTPPPAEEPPPLPPAEECGLIDRLLGRCGNATAAAEEG